MTPLDTAYRTTATFVDSIPKTERKRYGQFFTSRKSAEFMADLLTVDMSAPELHILDAGAGTGLLSVAAVKRLRNSGYKGYLFVCCYETDEKVLPTLTENMETLKKEYDIQYRIRTENFLLEKDKILAERYDIVIGNPPYLKISKDAPEALAMPEVCHGAPNLYFLFWAKCIQWMQNDGQLVYIIPRSWTSGAYFEKFRSFLFSYCSITHIHIFDSRDKVFDGEAVLQETMIIRVVKNTTHPNSVSMSASSSSQFLDVRHFQVPYSTVVAPNNFVFLVTAEQESHVLERLNRLPETLSSLNMKMHTGLIVDFRTREVLRSTPEEGSYPLFFSHHIREGRVVWPDGREDEYIKTERMSYLQQNADYVLVKRFTAKEEKRRLQCGICLRSDYPQYEYISTQNKINFIRCHTPEDAYGIYVLLNSSLYDSYYRILNGSTQVNSTEINLMPVPSLETVRAMGRQLMDSGDLSESQCNNIIEQWIN